jgi:Na+-transporting NADH:ubiquinone oxidoreductase subunit NqrC
MSSTIFVCCPNTLEEGFVMKMNKFRYIKAVMLVLALILPLVSALSASAQARLSDKDLEQRIKNMNEDIKRFRSAFNSSITKTSLRKTTQEKEAKTQVENFQKQANSLYQKFKSTKKPDPYLQNCLDQSAQTDKLLKSAQFDTTTMSLWAKIKQQLKVLAVQFNVPGY